MKHLSYSLLLLALTSQAFAGGPEIAPIPAAGKIYAGFFVGDSSGDNFNAAQLGTAYFVEASGGPLAVNALGRIHINSSLFYGGQFGYEAHSIQAFAASGFTVSPAAELEIYSTGNRFARGNLINNTDRNLEQNFAVTYWMNRTVYLANAILNFNGPRYFIHPYIGFGIGDAVLKLSNATSTQTAPGEPNINHFNSGTNDNISTFAEQLKIGLSCDVTKYISVFADYRRLHLTSPHFTLGSTIYQTHAPTSSWELKQGSQSYNLFNVGIRFKW